MFSNVSRRQQRLRSIGALATVLAVACTAACSSSSSGTGGSGKFSIQFVSPLPSYPTFKTLGECMQKEAAAKGADLTVSGPTGQAPDPATMISQIQQATVAKKGAIVTVPLSAGFAPVLQQAQKKGIETVTFLGPGGTGTGADLNFGYDWTSIGQEYVDGIAKLPGQQELGLVAAANTGTGKSWTDAVTAAAAKTSNVKIVGTVYTGDDATQALPEVNALLAAHPNVTTIATNLGTVTPGAVAALKAKNLTGKVSLVINGSDNGGTAALASGAAKLMFVQDVCGAGTKAVDALIDLSQHKKVPAVAVGTAVVDQSQEKSYLAKGWS